MIKRTCAALVSTVTLSGCVAALAAPSLLVGGGSFVGANAYSKHMMSKADRQFASAQAIGSDLNPLTIKVSNAKTAGTTVSWTAKVADGRRYACSQENGHLSASCVEERN